MKVKKHWDLLAECDCAVLIEIAECSNGRPLRPRQSDCF